MNRLDKHFSKNRHFTRSLLVWLVFTSATLGVQAATYYVSTTGDDANNGESPASAWQTIAHVNGQTLAPGDEILFKRGDTWRETLVMPSSGAPNAYIHFGAYGSGERPRILGSAEATDWEPVSGYPNIWRSPTEVPNPFDYYQSEIWFVETNGSVTWSTHEGYSYGTDLSALDALDAEYEATWVGSADYNGPGNLYVYCPENPDARYAAVEAPVRNSCIELDDQEYIAIDNLVMRYTLRRGVNENYSPSYNLSGLQVTNCDIGYMGVKNGSNMYGMNVRHSDMHIAHNEIHNCGRRGISLVVYDTEPVMTIENIVIEHNYFHSGYHTTGVDLNVTGDHTVRDVTIRYNRFAGDPNHELDNPNTTTVVEGDPNSNSLYIANQGGSGAYIGQVDIYGNVFSYASGSDIKLETVDDIEIYHNTFYGFNPTLSNIQANIYLSEIGGDITNITVVNNLFYCNFDKTGTTALTPVKVNEEYRDEALIDYNLYYSPDPAARLIRINYGRHYAFSEWTEYVAETGYDSNSPAPADPLFIDPASGDFRLREGSPAIGAGTPVPGIARDKDGNAFDAVSPSVGAYAFGGTGGTDPQYTLDLAAANGTIQANPDQDVYDAGAAVTLTAIPDDGFVFYTWVGDIESAENPVVIVMNSDRHIEAQFTPVYTPHDIPVMTLVEGNGTVVRTPDQGAYVPGTVVRLATVPGPGYRFAGWSGDITSADNPLMVTIGTAALSLVATFERIPVAVEAATSEGGSVTRTPDLGTYYYGDTVTLTATPADGYAFDGWTGDISSTDNPLEVTLTRNLSLQATFTPTALRVRIASAAGGAVALDPDKASYQPGETVVISATPEVGHRFVRWMGDVESSDPVLTLTLESDIALRPEFINVAVLQAEIEGVLDSWDPDTGIGQTVFGPVYTGIPGWDYAWPWAYAYSHNSWVYLLPSYTQGNYFLYFPASGWWYTADDAYPYYYGLNETYANWYSFDEYTQSWRPDE